MLEDMLVPNETHHRVEVITGLAGRRYWPAQEKLCIIGESLVPGGPSPPWHGATA